MPQRTATRGILVALVGCDGSGKSTLTSQLLDQLKDHGTAARIYLGQGSGDLGRRIGKLPLIGKPLHQLLLKKAAANHSKDQKIPGLVPALGALIFSTLRYRKFKQIEGLLKQYDFVLTDRYPQAELKGQFDGPSLVPTEDTCFLLKKISNLEAGLYDKMAQKKPDIIFRLIVTPELAHSRKPDHDLATLVRKCDIASKLHYNHSEIKEIDASGTLEDIKARILKEVLEVKARHDNA